MRLTLMMFMVCLAVVLTGCSGNKQVKGKVTLTDGTPLVRGHVVFEKEGFSARGEIQPDGTYVMGTLKDDDGVPAGEYTVYFTGATQAGENITVETVGAGGKPLSMSMPSSFTPVVAVRYTQAETSDLKCNVTKSMTYDIEVEPFGQ
jgi:hypothetical protein